VPLFFGVTGQAQLVGKNSHHERGGQPPRSWWRSDTAKPRCAIYAICLASQQNRTGSLPLRGRARTRTQSRRYTIHYTTDRHRTFGIVAVYSGADPERVGSCGVIVLNDKVVARADSRNRAPGPATARSRLPKPRRHITPLCPPERANGSVLIY